MPKPTKVVAIVALLLGLAAIVLLLNRPAGPSQPFPAAVTPASDAPTSPQPGALPPPLYLGLDAYRYWDKLSYLEFGPRIWSASTSDPAGSNVDNSHPVRSLSNGETVLFEQSGPAVMTFMRMQSNYGGPWNLYLDGNYITQTDFTALGQITPTTFPATAFPYPLSMNITQTQASSIIAAAIPFSQSMIWTAIGGNGNFYSLYRRLPYGTPLNTWTGSEPVSDVVSLLRLSGSDIAPTNILSQTGSLTVTTVETQIASLSGGPYQLRAIKLRAPFDRKVELGNARLRIYWDGEAQPSVDAPLKFLAGDGAGVYQPADRQLVQGWAANTDSDGSTYMSFNLYWPMPFTSTARLTLAASTTITNVGWQVRYEPFPDPPGWWAKFHANYVNVPNPTPGQDMTFLDYSGSGKLVGTVVNFTAPDGTLEGDPHFYLDDNNTPQVQVTGTEEWGTGGNYWNGGVQTSLPLGGLPSSLNNPPGQDIDGSALYRYLIADSIPFNRHLVVRWEHGGVNDVNDHPYRAACFWYGTSYLTARTSDILILGDPTNRAAHNYQSPAASSYTLTAAYEYPVHNPALDDTVISTTAATSFTLALDPNNVGAFLRRKFDYGVAHQRARVFIDNQPAGEWYSAGYSNRIDVDGYARRWRDEELPLPASLTAGKSSITVRVEFVPTNDPPNSVWTESRYSLYSLVLPPSSIPSGTPTPTSTLIPTSTPTRTATPSRTPTISPTSIPTSTYTPVPSDTLTPSGTPLIPTATRTPLPPTLTNIATPTNTPLPPTNTFTQPPSPTAAPTFTVIATTPLPSVTPGGPTLTPTDCANPFVDIAGNVFYLSIHQLNCAGVVSGLDATHFGPTRSATRAEFAKMLVLGFGWPLVTPTTPTFADVPTDLFAYAYIETGVAHQAISGLDPATCTARGVTSPCFIPSDRISRAQVTTLVVKARNLPISTPVGGPSFLDVPSDYWAYLFIETARANQIISGIDIDHFAPGRAVRRDELCKILRNSLMRKQRLAS